MVTEAKKSVLECMLSLDAKCAAPFLAEWYVQLIICLPLLVLVLRHVLNGLASMGVPMPFVNERIKDFTQDKARVSHLDRDVINHLEDNRQQNLAIMAKADATLQWLYGNPIFSLASYQRALIIALGYPILVMLLVWIIYGESLLGGINVLPTLDILPRLERASVWVGSILFCLAAFKYHQVWASKIALRFQWQSNKQPLIGWLILFLANTCVLAFAGLAAFALTNAIVVVSAISGAGAVSAVGAFFALAAASIPVSAVVSAVVAMGVAYAFRAAKNKNSTWWSGFVLMIYAALLLLSVHMPRLSENYNQYTTSASSKLFLTVLFLTCLPIINAFFDWLSVSFTRWLFCKYSQNNTQTLPWWWIAADLLVTVLLCLALYHSVILLLFQMEAHGWYMVNARLTLQAFNDQPLGGQSSWLTWLAITNFIPLGLHYLMIVWGIYRRRWGVPTHITAYLNDLQTGKSLSPTDARTLAMFLTWDRWLKVTAMLLLIPSMYLLLQWLLHWSLRVWL